MKTVKLYLVPAILILSSLALTLNTMNIKKNVELTKAKLTIDEAKQSAKKINSADVITIKQMIESIAYKNSLPVTITPEKGSIKIETVTDNTKDTKKDMLNHYSNILSFATTLAALPYDLEYNTFCIGNDCTNGFEMTLDVKGIN